MTEVVITNGVGTIVDVFADNSPPAFWLDGNLAGLDGTYSNGLPDTDNWVIGEILSIDPSVTISFTVTGFLPLGGTNYPVVTGSDGFIYVLAYDIPTLANFASAYDTEYPGQNFLLSNVTTSGSFTPCFYSDSLIATATGQVAVQNLIVGDLVRTANGDDVPVLWVGEAKTTKLFGGSANRPIRIKAGALSNGLPEQDLLVTPDHGMMIEGMVVNASALVNHDTIIFEPMDALPDSYSFYHVELENHDVIMANGAETESYLDVPTRTKFSNFHVYEELYGVERLIREMNAPRVTAQRELPKRICEMLGLGRGTVTGTSLVA